MDLSTVGSSLLILVIGGFMLWFAVGTQQNIRRGNDLLKWLQLGLPRLGKRTTLRWLGSSAVQLDIVGPSDPFDAAQVVVVLEPRDIGVLWAWARAHRRRDFVILRASMGRPPPYEVEAGNPGGWTGGDRLRKLDPVAWEREAWVERNVGLAHTPGYAMDGIRRVWEALEGASGGVWRLSVRRDRPHLEVHVRPPDTGQVPADTLLQAFRELAATVLDARP
jgi:hypothetical protein